MKYINKEEAKNGGIKYHLYIGTQELDLLKGMIIHYEHNIPRCAETMSIKSRLRNMKIVLKDIK